MPLPPGTNLGVYKILSLLGSGGMGEVYCALDPKLARRVAIKVLPDALSSNADSLARFEREARALAALQHPGILAVHDFGREGEWIYTVTELLEGKTLQEKLRHGPLPLERALQVAVELAAALAAAHDRGIIHRDLKPGNIFILQDGRMKLLDFGLAKQVALPALTTALKDGNTEPIPTGGDTEPGLLLGTAGYMSPEQVRGAPMDARTDLFAFGCLMHEMCTGRRVFGRENLVDTLHAILSEDPQLADPLLPPHVEQLIRRCLDKEPALRFQSALDLRYALESFQVLAPTPPRRPPSLRRRWVLSALTLPAVAAGALLAGALWPSTRVTPTFRPLTSERGSVGVARFTADGSRVVYAASWGTAPPRVFVAEAKGSQAQPLGEEGSTLFALSRDGALAIGTALRQHPAQMDCPIGRLVERSLSGGTGRTLGEGICAADWDPRKTGLAVVRHIDGQDRVEYPLGHVLEESPGWISHLRFAPKGRYLAFLNHPHRGEEGGAVTVVDAESGQRRILSDGWTSLRGLAWAPGGDEIWFTAAEGDAPRALFAVSLSARRRLVYAAPLSLTLHDVSKDGSVLFSQDERSSGWLGKAAAEEPRSLGLDRSARIESLSEDGIWLLYSMGDPGAELQERRLALLNLRTGQQQACGGGLSAAVSPDGDRILVAGFAEGRYQILLCRREGGPPTPLPIEGFTSVKGMSWHPDGQSAFCCAAMGSDAYRIWRIQPGQSAPLPISLEGVDPERPFRVSPDGHWLIVALGPVVYRVDLLGDGEPLPLPGIGPSDRILGFQDAGHVLLTSGQSLPIRVESYDLASGKRRSAFSLPALGHEGAQMDGGLQIVQGGSAYAGSYLEVRSALFFAQGVR